MSKRHLRKYTVCYRWLIHEEPCTDSLKAIGPAFTGSSALDTTPRNFKQPNSAEARVLLLTELLEEILLYLPTHDIMAIRSASPLFYYCISRSLRLQARLFLRPSKDPVIYHKWFRQNLDSSGLPLGELHLEEVKLFPRANTKTAKVEFSCQPSPVQPARICPLIHLWNVPENQLPEGFTTPNLPTCSVGITATPDELGKFGTMMFADPPIYEVCSRLHYRHNLNPKCYITGQRTVTSDSPLTIHGFLDAAFRMKGFTDVHDRDDTGRLIHQQIEDSFEEAVAERIQLHGGYFDLVFNRTPIFIKGIEILNNDRWDFMVRKRAEQQQEALASERA